MSQKWTIALIATGEVLCPSFTTDSMGQHPKDKGWAWNAATQKATRISAEPNPLEQTWSGTAWVDDPTKIQPRLIAKVKADNETRVRTLYTTNFGKQKKYSRKQAEVLDYRALGGTVAALTTDLASALFLTPLALMTTVQQRKKFRFAMAEAKLRNVPLSTIIGEYETAIETIEAQIADWEAIELEAIRQIKLAATATAKRAAYAAINWTWRSP